MLSYLQHPAWHFAVVLSFAFKPVPCFFPTPCQIIQSALLQVMCVINITRPRRSHCLCRPMAGAGGIYSTYTHMKKWLLYSTESLCVQSGAKLWGEHEPELPCCCQWSFSLASGILSLTSVLNLLTAWMLSCYLFTGVSLSIPCCNLAGEDTL